MNETRSLEETLRVFEQEKRWRSERDYKCSGSLVVPATVWKSCENDASMNNANVLEEESKVGENADLCEISDIIKEQPYEVYKNGL